MEVIYIKNFRKGFATNSSSTHSVIYKNKDELLEDLNVFELNFYGRSTETIAASKEAKIKYVAANIFRQNLLFDIMCGLYPEMAQYKELALKQNAVDKIDFSEKIKNNVNENIFGECGRGALYFYNYKYLDASIEYLKNIIDNDNLAIIGGSDELDFVFENTLNHKELFTPHSLKNVIKNGNYYIGYSYYDGDRLRFSYKDEECIPEYPELIDLRITNKCNHGCPFCFMDSTISDKHASLDTLTRIIGQLSTNTYSRYDKKVEFSIGGGNVLLYPELKELFKLINDNGHIINTTINAKDCEELIQNKDLYNLFKDYVNGLGISVTSIEDVNSICSLPRNGNMFDINSNIVVHLIPELLGVEKTTEILHKLNECGIYKVLFLGYKTNGRGATQEYHIFNGDELKILFEEGDYIYVSIDTTFAKRYKNWIEDNYDTIKTITYNEGEYSMYIDGVTGNAYKSSYELDKPYNLVWEPNVVDYYSIDEAFGLIREDCGFKRYKECND